MRSAEPVPEPVLPGFWFLTGVVILNLTLFFPFWDFSGFPRLHRPPHFSLCLFRVALEARHGVNEIHVINFGRERRGDLPQPDLPKIAEQCENGLNMISLDFKLRFLGLEPRLRFNPLVCFEPYHRLQRKREKRGKIAGFSADVNQSPELASAGSEFFSAASASACFWE